VISTESRAAAAGLQVSAARPAEVKFAIIGAGFAGLGAAIKLLQAGHRDLLVLERADEAGGTWGDNIYPGCRCDVQSNLYSFSFAPNPDWTSTFPAQPELRSYLNDVAARFGVRRYLRLGCDVTGVRWEETDRLWHITTAHGAVRARYVIAGVGSLVEPALPGIPGIDTFTGQVMHSARWDPTWSPAGRRVAVIGTGASAIQIVPAIQPRVEHLTVFQRTAPYVVPHTARPVAPWRRAAYRYVPGAQSASRAATYWMRELMVVGFVKRPSILKKAEAVWKTHMERAVADPVKREKLTPHYDLGCKRVLPSNDFYPAVAAANSAWSPRRSPNSRRMPSSAPTVAGTPWTPLSSPPDSASRTTLRSGRSPAAAADRSRPPSARPTWAPSCRASPTTSSCLAPTPASATPPSFS